MGDFQGEGTPVTKMVPLVHAASWPPPQAPGCAVPGFTPCSGRGPVIEKGDCGHAENVEASAEYGLILALIAVVAVTAVTLLGTNVVSVFTNIAGSI